MNLSGRQMLSLDPLLFGFNHMPENWCIRQDSHLQTLRSKRSVIVISPRMQKWDRRETRTLMGNCPAVYETAAVCQHLSLLSHIGEMVVATVLPRALRFKRPLHRLSKAFDKRCYAKWFTKYIGVVVVEYWRTVTNVDNASEVLFRLCANTDPQRDSVFIPQARDPSDLLDHATSAIAIGSKLGIDATKKLPRVKASNALAAADQDGCRGEGEDGKAFRRASLKISLDPPLTGGRKPL